MADSNQGIRYKDFKGELRHSTQPHTSCAHSIRNTTKINLQNIQYITLNSNSLVQFQHLELKKIQHLFQFHQVVHF